MASRTSCTHRRERVSSSRAAVPDAHGKHSAAAKCSKTCVAAGATVAWSLRTIQDNVSASHQGMSPAGAAVVPVPAIGGCLVVTRCSAAGNWSLR